MPMSPSDVEEYLSERFDMNSICLQIDSELRKSTYIGAEIKLPSMPRFIGQRVAKLYRAVGWAVEMQCDDNFDPACTFTLKKVEPEVPYQDR